MRDSKARDAKYDLCSRISLADRSYNTGLVIFTKKPVKVAKDMRARKKQRALMQFFKPENLFTVREALMEAGRQDLIGNGCVCLIPANPPKEAIEARRRKANQADDHYHTAVADRLPPGPEVRSAAAGLEVRRRFSLET